MPRTRRPTGRRHKLSSLQEQARESSLEAAAAALAAIHLGKQVRAESRDQACGSGRNGLFDANIRIPLGDVLFGVAQLQIDFARRLFELNRAASRRVRERLRRQHGQDPAPLDDKVKVGEQAKICFTISNPATSCRTFMILPRLLADCVDFSFVLSHANMTSSSPRPLRLTLAAGTCSAAITAELSGLRAGKHQGFIEVKSNGIVVEQIPFCVTVQP